jgi:hypothetical protein
MVLQQVGYGTFQETTPDCSLINLNGGTLSVPGNYSWLDCPLTNYGTLNLDSGTLTVSNTYTAAASSTTFFSVGGSQAANLTVATLNPAGTLSVGLTNGYIVTNGTTFDLINYTSCTGTFPNTILPPLSPPLQWTLNYGPTSLVLEAVSVPPQIGSPAMLPDGAFQFTFSGPSASNYIIQASTNFVDWLDIQTGSPFTGQINITDLLATNFSQRFYRGVVSN